MTDYYPNPGGQPQPGPAGQGQPTTPGASQAPQPEYPVWSPANYPAAAQPQPFGSPEAPSQGGGQAANDTTTWIPPVQAQGYSPEAGYGQPDAGQYVHAQYGAGQPGAGAYGAYQYGQPGYYPQAGFYAPPAATQTRSSNNLKIGIAAAAAGGMLIAAAAGFGAGLVMSSDSSDDASVRTTGDGLPQAPGNSQEDSQDGSAGTDQLPQGGNGQLPGTTPEGGTDGDSSQGTIPGIPGLPGSGSDDNGSTDGTSPDGGWQLPIPGQGGGRGGFGNGNGATQEEQLSAAAQAAADKVTPAVVNIDANIGYGSGAGAGTGIILTGDGKVLTNAHVISGASELKGTVVGTNKTYSIKVLGYDKTRDVALVQLEGASGLPTAAVDDSDKVKVGDLVVGVGNAGGDGGEPTSVEGKVTETGATITASDAMGGDSETLHDLIGTDANIQSGQSGGPMVDADGEVIGINTAAAAGGMGGFAPAGQSTGYAIPINDALDIANQIADGKSSDTVHIGETAFLGVQVEKGTGTGVPVAGAVEGSAAARAGLGKGDTILSVDGTTIDSPETLSAVVKKHKVGESITIVYTDSSGSKKTVKVTLGAGPAA